MVLKIPKNRIIDFELTSNSNVNSVCNLSRLARSGLILAKIATHKIVINQQNPTARVHVG